MTVEERGSQGTWYCAPFDFKDAPHKDGLLFFFFLFFLFLFSFSFLFFFFFFFFYFSLKFNLLLLHRVGTIRLFPISRVKNYEDKDDEYTDKTTRVLCYVLGGFYCFVGAICLLGLVSISKFFMQPR